MELEEFIRETVRAIANSTKTLQDDLQSIGVLVNPPISGNGEETTVPEDRRYHRRLVRDVEFDVAVTAKSSGTGKGGVSAKLHIVEFNASAGATTASETVSRVKFKIPLALSPTAHENENYKASEAEWNKPLRRG